LLRQRMRVFILACDGVARPLCRNYDELTRQAKPNNRRPYTSSSSSSSSPTVRRSIWRRSQSNFCISEDDDDDVAGGGTTPTVCVCLRLSRCSLTRGIRITPCSNVDKRYYRYYHSSIIQASK